MAGAELPRGRRARVVAAASACLLIAVCGASLAVAGGKHHHRRPHRQALGGARSEAPVPITKAPPAGGKGGGVDPGDDYPARWKNPPKDSVLDAWMEYNRECTSFVAWALHSRNGFEMPFYRNANRWGPEAQKRGYVVNTVPAVGSVAWTNTGAFGHVAYVVAVNGTNVTVEEYNYFVRGAYDKRVVDSSAFTGYIHFRDLAPAPTPPAAEPTVPVATPVTPTPAPKTWAETVRYGEVETYSNYAHAFYGHSTGDGPNIGEKATVQVTCAVLGARVEERDNWWYRVASSPWNNIYYAPADFFYNGASPETPSNEMPLVDPAVPAC